MIQINKETQEVTIVNAELTVQDLQAVANLGQTIPYALLAPAASAIEKMIQASRSHMSLVSLIQQEILEICIVEGAEISEIPVVSEPAPSHEGQEE